MNNNQYNNSAQKRSASNNLMREFSNKNQQQQQPNNYYSDNHMLNNNPRFNGFLQENGFKNKIGFVKNETLERLKKAPDFTKAGFNEQELIAYVINPFKIEKMKESEIAELQQSYLENQNKYLSFAKYEAEKVNAAGKPVSQQALVPKEIVDLWNGRNNNPYKQILHQLDINDYTKRSYKKEKDLIIHKTTLIEKNADIKILKKELKNLKKRLFNHNNELETIYSTDRKAKFTKKFEYENIYKNKLKYDPKNCSELKEIYKQEQKKLGIENRRIDDMIELLVAGVDLSESEMTEIKKNLALEETKADKYNNYDASDKDAKKKHKDLEKELEKEIEKELGKDGFKKLMNEFIDADSNTDSSAESDNEKKNKKKDKYKEREKNKDNIEKNKDNIEKNKDNIEKNKDNIEKTNDEPEIKASKKIIIIKKINKINTDINTNTGTEESDSIDKFKDKYKNRQ